MWLESDKGALINLDHACQIDALAMGDIYEVRVYWATGGFYPIANKLNASEATDYMTRLKRFFLVRKS